MKVKKSFKTIDFDKGNEFEWLRTYDWIGFADAYLSRCDKESKTGETIDKNVYCKLAKLDASLKLDERLGTKVSEQLYECLRMTTRWDIIKV